MTISVVMCALLRSCDCFVFTVYGEFVFVLLLLL